jgi:hypothetical protein
MIKPDDGPEINRWFSAEEVAQMALAFSIDAANTSPAMPTQGQRDAGAAR